MDHEENFFCAEEGVGVIDKQDIWPFDICDEFDCNVEYAGKQGRECKGDFTKSPCIFHGEHQILNEGMEA